MKKTVLGMTMIFALGMMACPAAAESETEMISEAVMTVSDEEGAEHLLELNGTYESLFGVLLDEAYAQNWLDSAVSVVGEEEAQEAVDMLQASITGDIIGEEAAEKYGYFDNGYAFYCGFTQDVDHIEIQDGHISAFDAEGNELASHDYTFVGYDEASGFYNYETADADAGEFTYFCFGFDTPEETYHIEFRYGSDLEALNNWVEGDYAYWMASGILEDEDVQEEMAKNASDLFVTENLAG